MKTLPYLAFPFAMLAMPIGLMAAQPAGEARFDSGVRLPSSLVVNDSVWTCGDGRCTGPAETRRIALQKACKTLARKVGAVTSLSAGGAALAGEDLERCNGTVRIDIADRAQDGVATQP